MQNPYRFTFVFILLFFLLFSSINAKAATPDNKLTIAYHPLTGKIRFIGQQSSIPIFEERISSLHEMQSEFVAPQFLSNNREVLGNTDIHNNLSLLKKIKTDSGTFNGRVVTELGITKVAKKYYYAQTNLLTSSAYYADLYYALLSACATQLDLVGITASKCQEVQDALVTVKMNLQPITSYNPDIAACNANDESPVNYFYDDLESGMGQWVSGATTGTDHWHYDWTHTPTSEIFAHSGEHFLYADDAPAEITDTTIRMNTSITIPANGKLIFHHAYAMETEGDGGVLEYSIDEGINWIDAGSLMDGNGYDAVLSSASNPLNGRPTFTGISNGYISTRLDLSPLAGQNVMFRFRMGLNASGHAYGWWLDDIQVYECNTSTRFAVIGDFGQAGQPEADVANLVHSWNPDFVITVGDNNYLIGDTTTIDSNIGQYYHQYIAPYTGLYGAGAISNNFYPALGNHDWGTIISQQPKPYIDYFPLPGNERYYDFTRGPIHFFVLDSDSHEPDGLTPDSIQGQWLQAALGASTSPWNIVYFHHPPYSSGIHGSNTVMQWPFQSWGADIVLSGHDHTYERLSINGFPYIVNGLGGYPSIYNFAAPLSGSQVRYNSDYGAMLVDATNAHVNFKFITRSGTIIDSYTLGVPSAPVINSIARTSPTPTPAASVNFTVTFSENVTGVDANDFSLFTSGVRGAAITGVTGSGSSRTVTVFTGSGNGSLRLDVPVTASITDLTGNSISGLPFQIGETYSFNKGFNPITMWTTDFDYITQGWRVDQHPRVMGDVNGDGKDDIVGFGYDAVWVGLANATGNGFLPLQLWSYDYSYIAQGWRVDQHPRMVGDVNGDGKADLVGFGSGGVWVALSTGTGFSPITLWTTNFGSLTQGWRVDMNPRMLGDVNGDGKDDVIGFGYDAVWVGLANAAGNGFLPLQLWSYDYSYIAQGWRVDQHPRMVGDVNGDGKTDLVGFGYSGVYVALSTGSSFAPITMWTTDFDYINQGWRVNMHPRMMGDVNGDGRDDIIGYGYDAVWVGLANSTGTGFLTLRMWTTDYSYVAQGWRVENHPRMIGDANGDGKDDLIGFGYSGVWVGTAK